MSFIVRNYSKEGNNFTVVSFQLDLLQCYAASICKISFTFQDPKRKPIDDVIFFVGDGTKELCTGMYLLKFYRRYIPKYHFVHGMMICFIPA